MTKCINDDVLKQKILDDIENDEYCVLAPKKIYEDNIRILKNDNNKFYIFIVEYNGDDLKTIENLTIDQIIENYNKWNESYIEKGIY